MLPPGPRSVDPLNTFLLGGDPLNAIPSGGDPLNSVPPGGNVPRICPSGGDVPRTFAPHDPIVEISEKSIPLGAPSVDTLSKVDKPIPCSSSMILAPSPLKPFGAVMCNFGDVELSRRSSVLLFLFRGQQDVRLWVHGLCLSSSGDLEAIQPIMLY